jgi:exopolysaccharide production protein ExoQ
MQPAVATLLTIVGIVYLLRRDAAHSGMGHGPGLWLPVMWLAITGSRFVSQWMDLDAGAAKDYVEGSIVDAIYFGSLILAGTSVLIRRGVTLQAAISANRWIAAFAIYGLISIVWSDFPDIAAKRWIKALGHPVMALIILTETDPASALRAVITRCAIVLLPTSVLFIKYLPQYGRGFDAWSGEPTNIGVGLTKNDLGYVCFVTGVVLLWNLITVKRIADTRSRWEEIAISSSLLCMAAWLLSMANSATSLAALAVASTIVVALGSSFVPKRHFGSFVVALIVVAVTLQLTFDMYTQVVTLLGRDVTLTDRTVVWDDALAMQDRPLLGFGFESFWLGDRLAQMGQKWWWQPIQAHNAYIEVYLNLGLLGLALLCGLLIGTFSRISGQLETDLQFARLRMGFFFAILLFNYTEAAFKGVHFVWTIFHLIAMEPPRRREHSAVVQ